MKSVLIQIANSHLAPLLLQDFLLCQPFLVSAFLQICELGHPSEVELFACHCTKFRLSMDGENTIGTLPT